MKRKLAWAAAILIVTVEGIALRYWNTTDTYRFSATFAENIDGSGERYTIEILLSFSEAE